MRHELSFDAHLSRLQLIQDSALRMTMSSISNWKNFHANTLMFTFVKDKHGRIEVGQSVIRPWTDLWLRPSFDTPRDTCNTYPQRTQPIYFHSLSDMKSGVVWSDNKKILSSFEPPTRIGATMNSTFLLTQGRPLSVTCYKFRPSPHSFSATYYRHLTRTSPTIWSIISTQSLLQHLCKVRVLLIDSLTQNHNA